MIWDVAENAVVDRVAEHAQHQQGILFFQSRNLFHLTFSSRIPSLLCDMNTDTGGTMLFLVSVNDHLNHFFDPPISSPMVNQIVDAVSFAVPVVIRAPPSVLPLLDTCHPTKPLSRIPLKHPQIEL